MTITKPNSETDLYPMARGFLSTELIADGADNADTADVADIFINLTLDSQRRRQTPRISRYRFTGSRAEGIIAEDSNQPSRQAGHNLLESPEQNRKKGEFCQRCQQRQRCQRRQLEFPELLQAIFVTCVRVRAVPCITRDEI